MNRKGIIKKVCGKILKVLVIVFIVITFVGSFYFIIITYFQSRFLQQENEISSLIEFSSKMLAGILPENINESDSVEKKIFDNGFQISKDNDLDKIIDNCFNKLLLQEIPKYSFSNESFSLWYKYENDFKSIIDKIDSLEVTKTNYYSAKPANILSSKEKNLYTQLYFNRHFLSLFNRDSILKKTIDEALQIINKERKPIVQVNPEKGKVLPNTKNTIYYNDENLERIKCVIILGDFCKSVNFHSAMWFYKSAYESAQLERRTHEMADIENKIALLYASHPNLVPYVDMAIRHYRNAADLFSFIDYSDAALLSQMKAINLFGQLKFSGVDKERKLRNYDFQTLQKTLKDGLSLSKGIVIKDEFYLYSNLGRLCSGLGSTWDNDASFVYYKVAAIAAMRDITDSTDIENVCFSLDNIAYVYADLKNEKQAMHYIDMALQYAAKSKVQYLRSHYIFEKANTLRVLGKYKEGLSYILKEYKNNPLTLNDRGYYVCSNIYTDLYRKYSLKNYKDSAKYYLSMCSNMNSNFINEIEDLRKAEPRSVFSDYQENKKVKEDFFIIATNAMTILLYATIIIIFLIISRMILRKEKRKIAIEKQQLTESTEQLNQEKFELELLKGNSDIHSAISRVLTRCLSHNIGSHVLSKFLDRNLVNVRDIESQYKSTLPSPFPTKPEQVQSALIANLNEYLKYRMDFLADIATTTEPVMESPMYLVRDIVRGFDKNRILLNRISGVNPEIKFELKILFNGEVINSYENQNDPLLSITNDILGAQAFYIILENIIRNIFKHGKPKSDFEIIIDVNHAVLNKAYYEVSIYDTIYKSKSRIEDVVLKRNTTLNESILDEEFKLRNYNLGSIEMSVCSAYLRCLPVDSFIKNEKFKINATSPSQDPDNSLIYAYSHYQDSGADLQPSENRYSLGYKFFISKPKQVLVISNNEFILTEEKGDLIEKGILVIKPEQINENFNSNHQFIYLNDGVPDDITDNFPSQLPKRKVNFTVAVKTDTADNFMATLWSIYIQENHSSHKGINFKYYNYDVAKLDLNSNLEDDTDLNVFIDDHHSHWGQPEMKECDFYDMACSHSKIFKLISTQFSNKNNGIYEYTENVFTQIIVIDERIQQNIVNLPGKFYSNTFPFYDYFYQQKIFIPLQEEADLNLASFGHLDDNQKSVANDIKAFIQNHINEATFCVIHLGILEKMLPSGTDKTGINIDHIIRQLFLNDDQRRKLIISSGRGGALNVPSDLSFVPLSMLQHSLETLFDKFVLTKLLYNSRKCK